MPPRSRGIGVSLLKKILSILVFNLVLAIKKALYHEDVLNERLVELRYESYQEVYYINKVVIKITIK